MKYKFANVHLNRFIDIEVEADHIDEAQDLIYDSPLIREDEEIYEHYDWDLIEGLDQYELDEEFIDE